MKITDTAREIIAALSLEANLPMARLAERIGRSERTCRRTVQQLLNAGVIKRTILINFYALGLCQSSFIFNLTQRGEASRTDLFRYLDNCDNISWLCENLGPYRYEFTYISSGPEDLISFLESLGECFQHFLGKRIILPELTFHLFGPRYLGRVRQPVILRKLQTKQIDKVDRLLLSTMQRGFSSLQEVSKQLGLPRSTVEYRVKRLEQNGVLAAHVLSMERELVGNESGVLLISGNDTSQRFVSTFSEFCSHEHNVTLIIRTLGAIDFKVTVEGPCGVVDHVCSRIRGRFDTQLNTIDVLSRVNVTKLKTYPFNHE